ncbi:phosphoglucosamine mutase [Nitrosomonas cryotolerans]|uniref:Phosphoglucosamine mutase n=1 Tax=Nitrosomonas cryotolerans ATCC 49181 TaxID=1131553 RepID=A0A1N6GDT7_9PROT|nr:phosphoglucosamine mutase [Nitrosomonas cryotolerans]SFP88438.1 phosphoglucosamine mutase [Nitrosomonas cryotolerans]SIO05708.1 phosphoglucosamine mutase [Nitrosomonas cryotolerans ATCC 49181]
MAKKYFGTDGIRGRVGKEPITPEFIMHLGYSAGKVLIASDWHLIKGERPTVLIGKDTRVSGYLLESALEAGLSAAGVDVLLSGPMPTPAIAYLIRALRLQAGIVISASHNLFEDNGIKFFSAEGSKLPDAMEQKIEAGLSAPIQIESSAQLGKVQRLKDATGRYIEFCKSSFPYHLDLRGLRIVVDCANGAAYHIAGHVLHELGADVITIGAQPDGLNINHECGATYSATLQKAVKSHHADLGIALDGDGDRVIMVDSEGTPYDGDQLIYIIARHRQQKDLLKGGIVGTLMTNLAIENSFRELDIPFLRSNVGDRYVLELLQEKNWQLGGESSGHIICIDKHTTGDGIISALQVLYALRDTGKTLAESVRDITLYPQCLINVKIPGKFNFRMSQAITTIQKEAESDLSVNGRVLLRASGTEPLIRVMVEGKLKQKVNYWAEQIANTVQNASVTE